MEHDLSLRPIGETDYRVTREARAIGRIRLADEGAGHEIWEWAINPPLPVPTWGVGRTPSLEEAKAAFKAAWVRFYERLTLADIELWHRHQDAQGRAEWVGWT